MIALARLLKAAVVCAGAGWAALLLFELAKGGMH